eukprot:TRINITY_DN10294_c1_g2_i1.p1 TRINITY_DN10294_c1_g2~~TRINITY_DN10294_c1_g2_i1.p1  ORF type:complete len:587 (+),score=124.46 TRINITY_DN10294_c1_g2_i1:104-1762(+)
MVAMKMQAAASAHTSTTSSAVNELEHLFNFILGNNEVLGAPSNEPVAPALRCVMLMTILFFTVFLTVVCLRLATTVPVLLGYATRRAEASKDSWEATLVKASEALSMAPILGILMLASRLRAIQVADEVSKAAAKPPAWAQNCMYGATAAFVLRFLAETVLFAIRRKVASDNLVSQGFCAIRIASLAALLICCSSITYSVFSMKNLYGPTEELGPMMSCTMALTITYLAESLLREALLSLSSKKERSRWEQAAYGSAGPFQARRVHERQGAQDQLSGLSLQFPPMICVLLLAISMRAVQLNLKMEAWSAISMYITSLAVIIQASRAMIRSVKAYLDEEPKAMPGDEACGPCQLKPGDQDVMSMFWASTTGIVYVGTALILLSVFAMEDKPLDTLLPTGKVTMKPLSTAMMCVMYLTVVYFGAYLVIMAGTLLEWQNGQWASNAAGVIQRALAFAPMLCVMMIAVRLRAMQLGVRDPPSWAQGSMAVATIAAVLQVVCSLLSGGDADQGMDSKDVLGKVLTISILLTRYLASAVLFCSVGSLIISLVWMQPVL